MRDRSTLGSPGQAGLSTRLRFSPQVLVVLVLAVPFFFCVREAIGAAIWAWHGASYRRVELVLDEVRPNAGYPYAAGHIEPGGEPLGEAVVRGGKGWVLENDRAIAFQPGLRVPIWWSPEAPTVGYGRGRYTNGMLVARFPKRPGAMIAVGWSLGALVLIILGIRLTAWVGGTRIYRSETPFRLE
jgi:hypothetical protein